MQKLRPFHLAIPVDCIEKAKNFYGNLLGFNEGRSSENWVDYNFFGHQLVCHIGDVPKKISKEVDGKMVPVPHFGVILDWQDFDLLSEKIKESNNENVWITDRGTQFGYQDLIVDFRGIPTMKKFAPTVLDVTHSLQQPNQSSGVSGGRPESIETIARAGIVTGVDGLFLETHFDPSSAKSDATNMLDLQYLEGLLTRLSNLRSFVKEKF